MTLTVLIPCAGNGSRFAQAGYILPKPLVDVAGKPMLRRVMDNLAPTCDHRFVIVSRLGSPVRKCLGRGDVAVHLRQPTDGAVATILMARDYLMGPLLLANCDQLGDFHADDLIAAADGADGAIVTFPSGKDHHSYVRTDASGTITEIAEKRVISNQAVTGVYYFHDGAAFAAHADAVVRGNIRWGGEFYVSTVIERMVEAGIRVRTLDAASAMLGTPEELQLFELAVKVGRTL